MSSILGVLNVSWVLQRRRENSTSTARSEISGVQVCAIDGLEARFTGELPTLIIRNLLEEYYRKFPEEAN